MMKQNFCDLTILFTKRFAMSSVKMETGTQSFPLSDGDNRETKKDSLIHEARHLIAFFNLFFHWYVAPVSFCVVGSFYLWK